MQFNLFKGQRGGRRPGSGRKRRHSRGVSHRTRERVTKRTPLHINFRFCLTIRNKEALKLLKRAILNAGKHGLRVIEFSMQSNHIHLIAESPDNCVLTSGMRALTVTFAKGMNKGRVQVERYHLHVLRNPREVRHAVNYVLFNRQKHEKGTYSVIDGYSSVFGKYELIQAYALAEKLTLKLGRGEIWEGPEPQSWLLSEHGYQRREYA